ncbi:MAG: uncharacterized protein JWN48_3008 [Myxococcaceae bacterium]|nr:uncharacterized protein [Myxococcaceae bacterium]
MLSRIFSGAPRNSPFRSAAQPQSSTPRAHDPDRAFCALAPLLALALVACGGDDTLVGQGGGSPKDAGSAPDGGKRDASAGGDGGPLIGLKPQPSSDVCSGLQCQQMECASGKTTTISGTIYDPAGRNPLYNIAVYVPNEAVEEFKSGATCDTCASLYTGKPIASALTDASGKFTLQNAPVGSNIPLVVQVGKWRRQFTIATVSACQDNPQPDKSLRLPKNRQEGDIPNIAVSTGGADTLECLLRRVGVDASEFIAGGSGEGRVNIFQGGPYVFGLTVTPNTSPGGPTSPSALWNSVDSLLKYDIVLLSCEGAETAMMNQQALHDYTDAGGRVFASHFHYSWFNSGPYSNENLATWTKGSNDLHDIQGDIVTKLPNGQPFAKGVALESWLGTVGALQGGKLPIKDAKHNADVSASNTPSQSWIVADQSSPAPGAAQYFSFNTPTPVTGADFVAGTCGRVVFSDLHVGAGSGDRDNHPVPESCADGELSAQEKALEFMLFDLSSCITPDTAPPAPPFAI